VPYPFISGNTWELEEDGEREKRKKRERKKR